MEASLLPSALSFLSPILSVLHVAFLQFQKKLSILLISSFVLSSPFLKIFLSLKRNPIFLSFFFFKKKEEKRTEKKNKNRYLDLSDNSLVSIPSLQKLGSLEELILHTNSLATLPPGLSSLSSLRVLICHSNVIEQVFTIHFFFEILWVILVLCEDFCGL